MTGVGGGEYVPVRRWIAVLLALVLAVMLMLDVFVPDYHVDPVVTGSILGAIIALVSVDVSKRFTNGGPK
jgi:hypothetical protein